MGCIPLPSLANDTQALLQELLVLHTPSKRRLIDRLNDLIPTTEETSACHIVLKTEPKEIQQARENSKRLRQGVIVTSMGTHLFTMTESLRRLMGFEWGRAYGCNKGERQSN